MTARAGESVILGCDVIHPLTGQPPPYVVEWFKFGVPIPIFIKFGFYPPHVDPEYAGESCSGAGWTLCRERCGGMMALPIGFLHPLLHWSLPGATSAFFWQNPRLALLSFLGLEAQLAPSPWSQRWGARGAIPSLEGVGRSLCSLALNDT